MESEEDKRVNSGKESKLATKIIFGAEAIGGLIGGIVSYNYFKTDQSAGYGFIAGAGLTTLIGIGYIALRDYSKK